MNILDLVKDLGYEPKRKAATHGGEHCSSCPFCQAGNDRLVIWANRHNEDSSYTGGRFYCRRCLKSGDAIDFLRLHGLSYREACARLAIAPKAGRERKEKPVQRLPLIAEDPPALWQEKARACIEWAHFQLLKDRQALDQIMKRGFSLDSIERFKIGFIPGNERGWDIFREREAWGLEAQLKEDGKPRLLWLPIGFTIPTFSADGRVVKIKIRRSAWREGDELPKYVEISGSKQCPSIYGDIARGIAFVLESEFDGLLIQQEAADLVYSVALGGSTKPLDFHTDQLLRNTPRLLFCPDFDQAGANAWTRWKKIFPHTLRILTPEGKAPGDAYLSGVDLREWIRETLSEQSNL